MWCVVKLSTANLAKKKQKKKNRKKTTTNKRATLAEILVNNIVIQHTVTFLSVYALQSGLNDEVKLRAVIARIPASEFFISCGDWNGHVGLAGTGYREKHDGMGYGRPEPDVEAERTLEYTLAFHLLLGNTF